MGIGTQYLIRVIIKRKITETIDSKSTVKVSPIMSIFLTLIMPIIEGMESDTQ